MTTISLLSPHSGKRKRGRRKQGKCIQLAPHTNISHAARVTNLFLATSYNGWEFKVMQLLIIVHVCSLELRVEVLASLHGSPQHCSLWVNSHVLLWPAQQVSDRGGENMNKLSEVRSRRFVCIPSKDTARLVHIMPNGCCIPSKHNWGLYGNKTYYISLQKQRFWVA